MTNSIFVFIAVLFFPLSSHAEGRNGGMEWQWIGQYVKESITFTTTGLGDANYKGSSIGVGTVLRISTPQRYGFGIKGGFSSRKGDNTANGTLNARGHRETESLSGSIFDIGLRFYALDVFIGLGGSYLPFTINYTTTNPSNTLPRERKYNGFGVNLELGIDLFLGNRFFITPKIEYRTFSAQPSTGASNAERMSNFGLGIGMGLAF